MGRLPGKLCTTRARIAPRTVSMPPKAVVLSRSGFWKVTKNWYIFFHIELRTPFTFMSKDSQNKTR